MSDSEVLNKFQEDLVVAGFKPKEYFGIDLDPKKWGECEVCKMTCYFCPDCGGPYHLEHLRQAENGSWSCLRCLGHEEELQFDEQSRTGNPR